MIELKPYFPSTVKHLIKLFNDQKLTNVSNLIIESDYGYLNRIEYKNGNNRIVYGFDVGINLRSSAKLANDKGYTKFLLRKIKIDCPSGKEYIMPWYCKELKKIKEQNSNLNTLNSRADKLNLSTLNNYPYYVKPVDGSKGANIFVAKNLKDLIKIIGRYNKQKIRVAVVEEKINMPDYRLTILDGKLVCAYKKTPLSVTGDGENRIDQLIKKLKLDSSFIEIGRIKQHLKSHKTSLKSVPKKGQVVSLLPISNLSAGGSAIDITDKVSQKIINLSIKIAQNFGLRFCGIDIACEDIESNNTNYSVFEVNATPGLDYYANIGPKQQEIVENLYLDIFNNY